MGPIDREFAGDPHEPSPIKSGGPKSRTTATKPIDLSRENPFLTIWTKPRATIRGIVDSDPTYAVIPITLVSGIVVALGIVAATGQAGKLLPLWAILGMAVVLGPIVGLVFLYIGAWLVRVSCRVLGRGADLANVRATLAWSMVPILATIPLWLARLVVFGAKTFSAELPSFDAHFWQRIFLLLALGLTELVLQIWSLVILLVGLEETQGLSVWKSLGCLLAFTLFLVILIAIGVAMVLSRLRIPRTLCATTPPDVILAAAPGNAG